MKPSLVLLSILLAVIPIRLPAQNAVPAAGPAGHWEGSIELPTTPLGVRVDLEHASAGNWSGTIDIPVQGLRGYKLGDLTVSGQAVSFAMPGIPGNPKFAGTLDPPANSISGSFTQAGQTYPFKLQRKAKTTAPGETPGRGAPGKGLAGHWQGSLKPSPVIELRLVLDLTNQPPGRLTGIMISLDQGGARIPITALTEKDRVVHLEARSVSGVFDGKLSEDGSEIAGDWQQAARLPLVFKRLDKAPSIARPQEPKKPYPYDEEEIVVENKSANVKLAGTFTWPRTAGPHAAVVLITGSGPQDRDEALMGHRPFLVLADHLTRQGIAVLRCDDRGFAKSTGNFSKATDDDFVEDTLACVSWLRTRKEVDPRRIGLIGHSEGGIVAPLAAVKARDISFIVLLAGVGVPMETLLHRQSEDILRVMGAGEETLARSAATQRDLFRLVKEEKDPEVLQKKLRQKLDEEKSRLTPEQQKAMGFSGDMLEGQIAMLRTPWFRQLLAYDPRPTLKAVKCPVLALNGEKDLQVAAKENLAAIHDNLIAGGNQRVKTVELPGLNHLFQACQTGAISEYSQIEETFNPKALKIISDWILETAGR